MTNKNYSIESEQSLIGSLLNDNDSIDKITNITKEHFYLPEHATIFVEIQKQILSNKKADVITVGEALQSNFSDVMNYLLKMEQSTPSSFSIERYADIIHSKWVKRSMVTILNEGVDLVLGVEENDVLIDLISSKLELLSRNKTDKEPELFSNILVGYMDLLERRMTGKIKPISTGYSDLDNKLDGGFDRGTLNIIAGRPGTGKSALGLGLARNISENGTCLFLSMEMSESQVIDRNVAAIGKIPLYSLKNPNENDSAFWNGITNACQKSQSLKLHIDDQTGLNLMQIRSKARKIKRKYGLDAVIIDQLSFITGNKSDKQWEYVGEYTRSLIQLSKELDMAVILLCQLNRDCERRTDKRPMLSDLASSGSIEQDGNTIIMLYRDEMYHTYNPEGLTNTENYQNQGKVEVSIVKQRQGSTGSITMTYIADQTRFEDFLGYVEPRIFSEKTSNYKDKKIMIRDV